MDIRHEFPFFTHNPNLVYLDSAATTLKPKSVLQCLSDFNEQMNVNVHRGSYQAAKQATALYENARVKTAQFINANNADNIVWTKGTTESINIVALSWAQHNLSTGDRIVVLASEHHANFVPWQQLAEKLNLVIDIVDLLPSGEVDLQHYAQLLSLNPKLVAIQHVSNALGSIYPIEEMTTKAKAIGSTVLIDGAQAVAHVKVDVAKLACDFYCFSGHKLYGPNGIGVLYIADSIKAEMKPVYFGGEMITSVSREKTTFRAIPGLLETGTPNIPGVVAMSAAIDFVTAPSYLDNHQRLQDLYQYTLAQLSQFENVITFGDTKNNVGIISFTVLNESIADLSALLDEQGFAVRAGHHCAMPLMDYLAVGGTIRVSLGIYNTKEDIDIFIQALTTSLALLDI